MESLNRVIQATTQGGFYMFAARTVRHGGVRKLAKAGLSGVSVLAVLLPAVPGLAGEDLANVPVKQRRHGDYAPVGIRSGGLMFYPSVTVGVQYDSNVFASVEPIDDWALVTKPELSIVADRGDATYELELGAKNHTYQSEDSENRTDAHARFKGSRQVTNDLKWDLSFEAARRHEIRGDSFSLTSAAEPIPYNDLRAETAVTKTFNRFGVTVGGRVRNLSYEDVPAIGGGTIDQSFRDGTIFTATLKPFYEFSPGYRAYARIDLSKRDYAGEAVQDRDSQGWDARGGLEFRLTSMLLGTVEAGYMMQDYDNPLIPNAEGVSAGSRLTWLMTPLMTVTLFAERAVAEMASPDQEGRLDFTAGAQLDYEILRNLILSLEGVYKNEDFTGTPRTDEVVKLSAKLDYLLTRRLNFGLAYSYIDRSSENPLYDFEKHVVTFNVTAQQ
jgi:hypothetical protein